MSETINVNIGGETVSVLIEGGAIGISAAEGQQYLNVIRAEIQQVGQDVNDISALKANKSGSNVEVLNFRNSLGLGSAATANIGVNPGQIALLGPDGKFPAQFLPENGSYLGSWDASANVPEIISGEGINGAFYNVGVAGATVIDGYPADPLTEQWGIGDQIRFSSISETWERIPDAGAANKLDRDGGNPQPGLLENIGAADVSLSNVDYQRPETSAIVQPIKQMLDLLNPTIEQFGGLGDETSMTAAVTTNVGASTVQVAGASFGPGMVGKLLSVPYGAGGNLTLLTKVAGVINPTTLVVANTPAAMSGVTVKVTWASDDSDALQDMLDNTLPGLAPCRLSRVYHITKPVYVRTWRTLQGTVCVGQILNRTPFNERNGIIVLWPGGKLIPLNGAKINSLTIGGADAMINPPTPGLGLTVAQNAWDRIQAWTGTAIECLKIDETATGSRDGAMDVEISDCSIIGMNKAIKFDNVARWALLNLKIDCLNGLELSNTYDTGRALNLHFWGFWNGNYGHNASLPIADTRPGIGIHLHSGVDGSLFNTALVYGFKKGVYLQGEDLGTAERPGVYACQFVNYWIDNAYAAISAGYQPIGFETKGDCRQNSITASHIDAHYVGMRFNHNNTLIGVSVTGCTMGMQKNKIIDFITGNGIINGLQLGGAADVAAFYFGTNHGTWIIDNVLAEDFSSPLLFYQPDPVMRRKITVGAVTTRNSPVFNRENFTSYVRVGKEATQSIPANTDTVLTFTKTGGVDSYGEFDTTTSAFYASRAGFYSITLYVDFAAANNTLSGISCYLKNQTAGTDATLFASLTTDNYSRIYSGTWNKYMVPGDVWYFLINSTVGGTVEASQTKMTVNLVSP